MDARFYRELVRVCPHCKEPASIFDCLIRRESPVSCPSCDWRGQKRELLLRRTKYVMPKVESVTYERS